MKCPKCYGRGEHSKHYNCGHGVYDAMMRGCNESVVCKNCKGYGYIGLEKVERLLGEIQMQSNCKLAVKLATEALTEFQPERNPVAANHESPR